MEIPTFEYDMLVNACMKNKSGYAYKSFYNDNNKKIRVFIDKQFDRLCFFDKNNSKIYLYKK